MTYHVKTYGCQMNEHDSENIEGLLDSIGFTKEDALSRRELKYIRVLGFNKLGRKYLNKIKKEVSLPIYTNFKKDMDLELKVTSIYDVNLVK